jgi:hypothetical protein
MKKATFFCGFIHLNVLKKLYKLAKETRDLVLSAIDNSISYSINNPDSLRLIYEFKPSTSLPTKAGPQNSTIRKSTMSNADNFAVDTSESMQSTRVKKLRRGVDMTLEEFVENLKASPKEEMVSGFGSGKDVKLPRSWVRDYVTEEAIEYEKEEAARIEAMKENVLVCDFEKLVVEDAVV